MIAEKGYPVEVINTTTADCYILELHRIPHGRFPTLEQKPPVLLLHGILGSSADWVMGSPEQSLGFILADKGYDVWLGNIRGNTYSRNHCSLDPDETAFWEFSFDEVGSYDIPAMIDMIKLKTEAKKIFYVGFSMGTTSFFAMANDKEKYLEDLALVSLMAPVAYVDHMISPLKYIAPFTNQIDVSIHII